MVLLEQLAMAHPDLASVKRLFHLKAEYLASGRSRLAQFGFGVRLRGLLLCASMRDVPVPWPSRPRLGTPVGRILGDATDVRPVVPADPRNPLVQEGLRRADGGVSVDGVALKPVPQGFQQHARWRPGATCFSQRHAMRSAERWRALAIVRTA